VVLLTIILNPKPEYQNPKQIKMIKIQMTEKKQMLITLSFTLLHNQL